MNYNVGNWIKDGGLYFQIEEICKLSPESLNKKIGARYNKGCFWCELYYLEPIPLTEDILLKCGFELHRLAFSNKFTLNRVTLFSIDNVFYAKTLGMDIDIKYVHQLQNLYYALTNEKLNIQL